jgi:hypothetical protein
MYKITITELEEIKKALLIANRELLKNKKHLMSTQRMKINKAYNIVNSYLKPKNQ